MSLFGTILKQGAKYADEAFDASRVQAKQADEVFDEEAWVKANPRPHPGVRYKDLTKEQKRDVQNWSNKKQYAKKGDVLRERSRVYGQKNKDKVRDRNKKYYADNRDAQRERGRKYREENSERVKETQKNWRDQNRDYNSKRNKDYRDKNKESIAKRNREYRLANRDEIARKNKEWQQANRGKVNANNSKRRAARLQRTPSWTTEGDVSRIDEIYDARSLISEITGIPHHVDHIIPLQGGRVSGLHTPDNLLIVPGNENLTKYNNFDPGDPPPIGGVDAARSLLEEVLKSQGR